MKNAGIVRCVDDLGRVVIPVHFRRVLNVQNGDPLEISLVNNEVRVKKYAGPLCAACGQNEVVHHVGAIGLCGQCVAAAGRIGA